MKIREILSIENFNPLEVDVSFLNDVSSQIPEEGYMDPAMAEHLATATLRAADRCIDLLAQATLFLSHCDARRKSMRSTIINEMRDQKVPSTIIKEAYADDPRWVDLTNKYNIALGWSTWLENKHATLIKTHHLCKDLIKRAFPQEMASDWTTPTYDRPPRTPEPSEGGTVKKSSGKSSWKV